MDTLIALHQRASTDDNGVRSGYAQVAKYMHGLISLRQRLKKDFPSPNKDTVKRRDSTAESPRAVTFGTFDVTILPPSRPRVPALQAEPRES